MYFGALETQSNKADWEEAFVLTDSDTGDTIDISLCRITMTVRKLTRNPGVNRNSSGYGASGYGAVDPGCIALTGSTDTGEITLPDVGTFQWLFPATTMFGLIEGEYEIGVRISQDTRIVQLIVCTVNIVEGIDMQ
jgi:hypothetical protein